ncbi:extracellular solute-binding protein [Notoacmeibacter sp. MSK16QG-6]|uniref:extracellular solute-binding protein n=1 Tax=Notoacmeibacter sp. MSK16QG-6 TaxID=2957982 RepID=UPI00209E00A7|nr:extracellular solute-binding protein [Notoacmeibacter sp. MSK16QG-6]MCP1198749.1 extracellular solute-binding protein [Notoacmeibacter sp. MSK16QG-6]
MADRSGFQATRRSVLTGAAALSIAPLLPRTLFAETPRDQPLHGLSAFGELKYGLDFTHFDFANPDAPKGGRISFQAPNWIGNQSTSGFDTLNIFVLRGIGAPRLELTYDSLMTPAPVNTMAAAVDEPDSIYGLLAESVTIEENGKRYRFRLRPEARFHDGTPVTSADVVDSYERLQDSATHPYFSLSLTQLAAVEANGEHEVSLVFSGVHSERTILSAAALPIIAKSFWNDHPYDGSQLVAPLGSGPYRVGRMRAGTFIEYERDPDYWGANLPVRRGLYHFDVIRVETFRDHTPAFESFKKGETLYREEFSSQRWAQQYDFPALRDGRVVKREVPEEEVGSFQGMAINRRRAKFDDLRTRQALDLCFDFDWMNRQLFFGQYERTASFFHGSEFAAEGPASEAERALLEPFVDELSDAVFGPPPLPAKTDGSGQDRATLREAARLLKEAGWTRGSDGLVVDEKGQRLTVELLIDTQGFVRILEPYSQNLRRIGIDASVRLIEPTLFERRVREYDFDCTIQRLSHGATPSDDDLALIFSSDAAEASGTQNLSGTKSTAVDAMIAAAGKAESRDELRTALRALDRVMRHRQDWVLNWSSPNHRVSHWDVFGYGEKPPFGFAVEALWWWEDAKAEKLGLAYGKPSGDRAGVKNEE